VCGERYFTRRAFCTISDSDPLILTGSAAFLVKVSVPWLKSLQNGITIEGMRYRPVQAKVLKEQGKKTWLELTVSEGKNRELRRILGHMRLHVVELHRIRFGPYFLGDLPPGAAREVKVCFECATLELLQFIKPQMRNAGAKLNFETSSSNARLLALQQQYVLFCVHVSISKLRIRGTQNVARKV